MKYDFITVLTAPARIPLCRKHRSWGVSPVPAQRIPMWIADMSFPTAPPILEDAQASRFSELRLFFHAG